MTSYGSDRDGQRLRLRRRGRSTASSCGSAPTARSRFAATCCCGAYRDGTDPRLADGWYPTGDHGQLDDDGRLRVDGRLDDLIITGGENVWPQAVEQVLAAAPSVAEVAVVGRPDPEWGQQVVALVVPTPSRAAPDPRRRCATLVKAQLPAYAAPRQLELVERPAPHPAGQDRAPSSVIVADDPR